MCDLASCLPFWLTLLACGKLIEAIWRLCCLFSDVPEDFTTSQLDPIVPESQWEEERHLEQDRGGESREWKSEST